MLNTQKLDSHYYLFIGLAFYSITLHSFDAVLCQMIVLDYGCIRKLKNAAFGGCISR